MKKIILISLGVVVLLVVTAVVVVAWRIDAIVEHTVEREGTSQLDLQTTLGAADVGIFSASLTLDELAIANPEGYTSPVLLQLGQVNVGVSYGQLTDDPVRVNQVNIASPRLVIERTGEGLENLAKINIRDLMDRLDTGEEAAEPSTKLIIDQLTVSSAQVAIRPNIQGLEQEYIITIPDVTLNNIGTGEGAQNGAEIGRVTTEVVMALARRAAESEDLPPELRAVLAGDMKAIVNQYADKLRGELREELQQELDELGEKLGTDLGGAAERALQGDTQGAVEDATKKAGEAVQQEAQKRLGDLLGGGRRGGGASTQPTTRPGGGS